MAEFTAEQEAAYKAGLVRFHRGNKVIGAGFYVANGYVLTCAHVVRQCLGIVEKTENISGDAVAGQSVEIDFPFVDREKKLKTDVMETLWRSGGQDIAVLRVENVPEGVTPISLKIANSYRNDPFLVYGFPEGHVNGLESKGKFYGFLANGWVQVEDTNRQGIAIEPGFSGAPLWDKKLQGVVGVAVARDKDRPDAKMGFMLPVQEMQAVFRYLGVSLKVEEMPSVREVKAVLDDQNQTKTVQNVLGGQVDQNIANATNAPVIQGGVGHTIYINSDQSLSNKDKHSSRVSGRVKRIKLQNLERQMQALEEDLTSLSDQLIYTIGSVDRNRLWRQIAAIESEMGKVAEQIDRLEE